MDSGPDDGVVGYDEFGRPVYRSLLGHRYGEGLAAQPHQPSAAQQRGQEMMQAAQAGQMWQLDNREDWGTPGQAVNQLLGLLAEGAISGVTAPGRAARGDPVTYGDVLDTAMDWGVMSNLGRAPAGALRSGTVASEAVETPAEHIARLLREGRADDITDDMLSGLMPNDNMELALLYANGETGVDMPMDFDSRMARAREMGRISDQYHATNADFPAFIASQTGLTGRGIYTGDSAPDVFDYARARQDGIDGLNIIPLVTPDSSNYARRIDWQNVLDADPDLPYNATWQQEIEGFQRAAENMSGQGFLGVHSQPGERVTFEPRNVRSRFARFDPRLRHLANLSAGIGGAAFLPGLLAERNPDGT